MNLNLKLQSLLWLSSLLELMGTINSTPTQSKTILHPRLIQTNDLDHKNHLQKRNLFATAPLIPLWYVKAYNRQMDQIQESNRLGDISRDIRNLGVVRPERVVQYSCPEGMFLMEGGCI